MKLLETRKVILRNLSEIQEKQTSSEASLLQMNSRSSTTEEGYDDFDAVDIMLANAEVCLDEKYREMNALNRRGLMK